MSKYIKTYENFDRNYQNPEAVRKLENAIGEIYQFMNFKLDDSICTALNDSIDRSIKINIISLSNKFPNYVNYISDQEPEFPAECVSDCIDYTCQFLDDIIADLKLDILDNKGMDKYFKMVCDDTKIKAVMIDLYCKNINQISDVLKNISLIDDFEFDIMECGIQNLYLLLFFQKSNKQKYSELKSVHEYSIKNKILKNE